MADILVKRIEREHGDKHWVFFRHGDWVTPIMILTDHEARQHAAVILGIEDEDPVTLAKALEQRAETHGRLNLVIEQISALAEGSDLPLFETCPNCEYGFSKPRRRCSECQWPPKGGIA